MKKSAFTILLILTICLGVIAQTDEDECQNITIKAPSFVQPNNTFNVSATFEKNELSDYKYDWIIINEGEVTKIKKQKSIKVSSKDLREIGRIIILAESSNKPCENTVMAEIIVIPPIGSPLIFDIYEELDWKEEKIRLDSVAIQMLEMEDQELLISVDYDIKLEKRLKNYLFKILNHLSTRKLKNDRITFLVASSEKRETKLQPFPQNPKNFNIEDFFGEYLIIKGEDLEKLDKLFK